MIGAVERVDSAHDVAGRFLASYGARIGAISAVGLLGRLLFLGYQPLWRDEAFTAVVVQRPLPQMLDAVRADSAPPLAYLLEHAVAPLWSIPVGVRLIPALAGTAAIPLGAALGRRIAGNRGGLLSAALCAVAPALFLSARDARMYALASTLVIAAALLLWRAVEQPSPSRWAAYAGAVTLSVYTDYLALLAIVAQLLAIVLVLRVPWRRTLAAAAAALAGTLTLVPWLIVARAQFGHASGGFWVPPLSLNSVGGVIVQFFAGIAVDPWISGKVILEVFQGLAIAAGLLAAGVLIARSNRLSPEGRRAARFCAACGLGAVLVLVAISLWRPLLDGRYASVLWGSLFPLLGAGLALVSIPRLIGSALIATAGASLAVSVVDTHPDTRAAIAHIAAALGPNDLVDAYPSEYLLMASYADPVLLSRTRVVQSDVSWFWGTAAYPPGVVIPSLPASVIKARGTVYYVAGPDDPAVVVPLGYRSAERWCGVGVCVTTETARP